MKNFIILSVVSVLFAGVPVFAKGNITIIYDNTLHRQDLKPDWGFSCLIEGTEKTILFDTGTNPEILLSNAKKLNINFKNIDCIVLSHNHHDHTGGLDSVLQVNPDVTVYYPHSFPAEFTNAVRSRGAEPLTVTEPVQVCRNLWLTGKVGDRIIEQSLIIDTAGWPDRDNRVLSSRDS